jgi:hypothetical protein
VKSIDVRGGESIIENSGELSVKVAVAASGVMVKETFLTVHHAGRTALMVPKCDGVVHVEQESTPDTAVNPAELAPAEPHPAARRQPAPRIARRPERRMTGWNLVVDI